jgi:uncharacterized protein YecE (DUF72 family)
LLYSDEVLNRIIESLNPTFDNVLEFRDPSWWNKKVYNALKKHKISFCGISHPTLQDDVVNNNSLLYYRFHGVPVLYKSEYKKVRQTIKERKKKIAIITIFNSKLSNTFNKYFL